MRARFYLLLLVSMLWLSGCATTAEIDGAKISDISIDELKQQAEMASYAGASKAALINYQQILAKQPDNIDALIGAGEALLAASQPERAEIYLERALSLDPKNPKAKEARALAWLMQGKYSDAARSLNNLIDDGVEQWRTWNALGVIADLGGDYSKAGEYYQRAILLEANKSTLYNNLGYSQMMAHDYEGAEVSLRKALFMAPGSPRTVNNLSLALAWQNKYDEAVNLLHQVMDEAASYNNVGYIAYLKSDYSVAEEYFRKAMTLKPNFYQRASENLKMVLYKKQAMTAH